MGQNWKFICLMYSDPPIKIAPINYFFGGEVGGGGGDSSEKSWQAKKNLNPQNSRIHDNPNRGGDVVFTFNFPVGWLLISLSSLSCSILMLKEREGGQLHDNFNFYFLKKCSPPPPWCSVPVLRYQSLHMIIENVWVKLLK